MIEKLKPYINNNLVEILPFFKINKGLTNFTTYQISVSIPMDVVKTFDVKFDFVTILINQLRQEINQSIYRRVNTIFRNTTKIDYIDLREYENMPFGHRIDGLQIYDKVFSYINASGYKNLISPSKIAADMQDHGNFYGSINPILNNNYLPYKIGRIGNIDILVDPYLRYNDDKIIMFDEIEINFDVKNISVVDDCTFSPRAVVEFSLCTGNTNSVVVSIIESKSSPSYSEYISIRRGIKIDDIIK